MEFLDQFSDCWVPKKDSLHEESYEHTVLGTESRTGEDRISFRVIFVFKTLESGGI
jgi:hypothetical protein